MTTGKLLATAGILLALVSHLALAEDTHAFIWTSEIGMQDVGTIPNTVTSSGSAINRSGGIVGGDSSATKAIPFQWNQTGGMRGFNVFGSSSAGATGINNAGQVVGTYLDQYTIQHGFLWSPTGGTQDLGSLGGGYTYANAISNAGVVVGASRTAQGDVQHAYSWTQSGGMQDLGTLPGSTGGSIASAINDKGQIVGQATDANGVTLAVMWQNGKIRVLGKLGGFGRGALSAAIGINNLGQVVGTSTVDTSLHVHAFLWTPTAGMQDLGTLSPDDDSTATGINNFGQVVGYSNSSFAGRAFLWTTTGGMQDLGSLGGTFTSASAINDAGQVTGASDLP